MSASPNFHQPPSKPGEPQAARTVQLSLDVDADVLIENADGKRLGLDFKTKKFVEEIPGARMITRDASSTFVLPFDKSGKLYLVSISSRSTAQTAADLSMTGPGFVVGFRELALKAGVIQKVSISSNGSELSFTATQDGPTPQLFLTTQSGRDKPSFRFEVVASLLSNGKTIRVNLDLEKGRLYFKTDDSKKGAFSVMMRRTNPGGGRETYKHQNISFARDNGYAMDFGPWDGKGEICFYDRCDGSEAVPCTKLANESGQR
jgi:hypothetical protein